MMLIGQYDSPFVRRVAIALRIYGMPYRQQPWSTFGDADRIAPYNPLRRVPTLVLDSGEVLIESAAMLDYLDEQAGPARALIAACGAGRRHALRICALATGLADKTVSLIYERALHAAHSQAWIDRCTAQIVAVLGTLEADRAARETPYWFGERIGHGDIAVACALRLLREAHGGLFDAAAWPALAAHAAWCEALEPFGAVTQVFVPPR